MSKSLLEDCPYNCDNGYVFLESQGRVPCPHCLDPVRMTETVQSEDFGNIYDALHIPIMYRNLSENTAYAWLESFNTKENKQIYGYHLQDVIDTYTKILNSLSVGELYRDSIYFCFTITDVDKLIYGTQILALLHGVGTVPYISLNRLSHLLYSNDVLNRYSDMDTCETISFGLTGINTTLATRVNHIMAGIDYMDYVTAPLCILELTAGTLDTGFLALRDLLAERARLSLPTYVIGFCSMHKLVANGEYMSLGHFEGVGLRKLTEKTLLRSNLKKQEKVPDTLLNYTEIGETKQFGIQI